jgi:O-antigen/teichoic acid export membrane protein
MDLQGQVLSALRWNALAKFGTQLISWVITIAVMRLLTPGDYGLVAMATVAIAFLSGLADLGLGGAIVQASSITERQLRQVQGAVLLVGAVMSAVIWAGAPLIEWWFAESRLVPFVRVIAFEILVGSFASVSHALLLREMRFRAISGIEIVAGIATGLLTLALAWKGWGAWSLVLASLARAIMSASAVVAVSGRWVRPAFSFYGIEKLLSFGGLSSGAQLLYRLNNQLEVLIGGRLLGKDALGAFSVAMHLANLPASKLASVVGDVILPTFARLQSASASYQRALLTGVSLMSFALCPVFMGLSALAPELVSVLLGERWHVAIAPLVVLPLAVPFRMIAGFLASAAAGLGHPIASVRLQSLKFMLIVPALILGAHWGLIGLSIGATVMYPIVLWITVSHVARLAGISPTALARSFLRPLLMSLLTYAPVLLLRELLPSDVNALVKLIVFGLTMALGYLALSSTFNKVQFRSFWSFTRQLGRGGAL